MVGPPAGARVLCSSAGGQDRIKKMRGLVCGNLCSARFSMPQRVGLVDDVDGYVCFTCFRESLSTLHVPSVLNAEFWMTPRRPLGDDGLPTAFFSVASHFY